MRRYRVLRAADDPNFVVIELEFDGAAEAEAFTGRLRELWGRVTDELGLVGRNLRVLDSVETIEY